MTRLESLANEKDLFLQDYVFLIKNTLQNLINNAFEEVYQSNYCYSLVISNLTNMRKDLSNYEILYEMQDLLITNSQKSNQKMKTLANQIEILNSYKEIIYNKEEFAVMLFNCSNLLVDLSDSIKLCGLNFTALKELASMLLVFETPDKKKIIDYLNLFNSTQFSLDYLRLAN